MINFQIGCYKTNDPVLCEDGTTRSQRQCQPTAFTHQE